MYTSKGNRRDQSIRVLCTITEKRYIAARSRSLGFPPAVYLRELGLTGDGKKPRTLPPPVLAFNGQLAQIIGSLEIISRRRLDGDDLNALERAELQALAKAVKQLMQDIKTLLQ